jgi:hypothetical protein
VSGFECGTITPCLSLTQTIQHRPVVVVSVMAEYLEGVLISSSVCLRLLVSPGIGLRR